MTAKSILEQHFDEKFGLERRNSVLTRSALAAVELQNIDYEDGRLTKRKGCRVSGNYCIGRFSGIYEYTYSTSDSGETQRELVAVRGTHFSRQVLDSFTISYTGAGAAATFSLLVNASNEWEVSLEVDGTAVAGWPKTYGSGIYSNLTPASFVNDIADLITDINAEADWASTSPTYEATVAALGSIGEYDLVASGNLTLSFEGWLNIQLDVNSDMDSLSVPVVPASFLNAQDVCYFCIEGPLLKYDGLDVYRAGVPQGIITSVADTGAGATFAAGEVYIYKVVLKRIDNRGNIIEGADSDDTLAVASHTVAAANTDITLTINTTSMQNGVAGSKEFAACAATVNGVQNAVTTITVDAGHTLQEGHTAYFYDGVSGEYVTREITGIAATTITIRGAAVNVADNIVISNNIRIQIYRTEDAGIEFYLVEEIPYDANNATQTYVDQVPGASLGRQFLWKYRAFNLPPENCRILALHQGKLIISGDSDNPNTVYFSDDVGGLEAFPAASNSIDVPSSRTGIITYVESDSGNRLAVCKSNSYYDIDGDLEQLSFIVTEKSKTLGIATHTAGVKIGSEIIGLCRNGFIRIQGGEISQDIGLSVRDDFRNQFFTLADYTGESLSADLQTKFVPERAIMVYDDQNEQLLCHIPCFSGWVNSMTGYVLSDPQPYPFCPNENSRLYVFDAENQRWWIDVLPNRINWQGGACMYGTDLFFVSVYQSIYDTTGMGGPFAYQSTGLAFKSLNNGNIYDYADNVQPIEWIVEPNWNAGESPSSFSKALRLKLLSMGQGYMDTFEIEVTEYRNYNESTTYTEVSRTFGSATDLEKIIKMTKGKRRSIKLRFYNNNIYERPQLDGFELEVSNPYVSAIKDGKS